MSTAPDFLHEMNIRRHGLFSLPISVGVLVAFIFALFLIPMAQDY